MSSNVSKHSPKLAEEFQQAYDYFNEVLFNSELPQCILVLCNSNRRTLGYYHQGQYVDTENAEVIDKIALNPQWFAERGMEKTLSTLVHEMCHLYCFRLLEKPPRHGYHCKRWGAKMKEVGLYPSNTGEEGGKETGQSVSHYILEDGPFKAACTKFLSEHPGITYMHRIQFNPMDKPAQVLEPIQKTPELEAVVTLCSPLEEGKKTDNSNRVKYTCPKCETNVWGKPNLRLVYADCEIPFEPQEK